jgi:hypothetical protein
MARQTLADLKREIEERDQEIGRLNHLVSDMRVERAETLAALRLMKTLVEDALK